MKLHALLASCAALVLAGCSGNTAQGNKAANDAENAAPQVLESPAVAAFPEGFSTVGEGFPNPGDPCRNLGETAATANYIDTSSVLVGCPDAASAQALGGEILDSVQGAVMVSVPMGGTTVDPERAASPAPQTQ